MRRITVTFTADDTSAGEWWKEAIEHLGAHRVQVFWNASAKSCQRGYRWQYESRLAAGDTTFGKGKQPKQRVRYGEITLVKLQERLVAAGLDAIHDRTWKNYRKNWEDGTLPENYHPINDEEYVVRRGEQEFSDRSRDDA